MNNNFKNAKLVIEDGTTLEGKSFGYDGSSAGEVVFNTAMTGYPESLTDPSYKGQILTLSYPLVGNYGAPVNYFANGVSQVYESDAIQASGLVISNYSDRYNHWNAAKSLSQWLIENKVPAICDIDTRALVQKIRDSGALLGKIIVEGAQDCEFYNPNEFNLVDSVSVNEKKIYGSGKYKIILIDCGVKANIIRALLEFDTTVVQVPWNYDFTRESYDGLFISNGPGDPTQCIATIEHLKKAFEIGKPIFGICLGHQLMALASGARTYKLKYGHRSHNQPVLIVGTNRAYISSQNHGFAVDDATLNAEWTPYFKNLNDGSNEGIKHIAKPFFSVQFHPEASGGPEDTDFLFNEFIARVEECKTK